MNVWIEALLAGERLGADRTEAAFRSMLSDQVADVQIAAFLVALRMSGETFDEVAGAARVMRDLVRPLPLGDLDAVDVVGTGGDGARTFNISTAAAIVVAAGGVPVAKHGNVSVSSSSGSADVLSELGIDVRSEPEVTARSIREVGIGFLFAPLYHPAMKRVAGIRRDLGLRTIFNILGPISHPSGVRRQLLGVYSGELVLVMARALKALGVTHAVVVHGEPGLDEIAVQGRTRVAEVRDGAVREWSLVPEDLGLGEADPAGLVVSCPAESASKVLGVLRGEGGAGRLAVLLNAGMALYVGGAVPSPKEGVQRATELIDDGRALDVLDRWRSVQGTCEPGGRVGSGPGSGTGA